MILAAYTGIIKACGPAINIVNLLYYIFRDARKFRDRSVMWSGLEMSQCEVSSSNSADEECWKLPEQDFLWDTASELALYQVSGRLSLFSKSARSSVADPVCLSRIKDPNFSIPDPSFFQPGTRTDPHQRIEVFFQPKILFLCPRRYNPGCSSQIPDPGVKRAPDPGSGSVTLARSISLD